MKSHNTSWFVVVNPEAGNGAARQKWPKINALLLTYKFNFETAFTTHKNHSKSLVINAINSGFIKIICVGGDGTIHHVVNGIMQQDKVQTSTITLGVIPVGTGNDWVKTYGISSRIEKAIKTIKSEQVYIQDIGKIDFLKSKKEAIYFNNMAGIGFDGFVAKKAESLKTYGKIAYLLAALQSFYKYKNINVTVETKNESLNLKALMVLVGLCKFSGGGMRLTHDPKPNDGLFDVSLLNDFTKWDVIKHISKLYTGKINRIKKINHLKTNTLVVNINTKDPCFIQADGEVFEGENIRLSIKSKALKMCYNKI